MPSSAIVEGAIVCAIALVGLAVAGCGPDPDPGSGTGAIAPVERATVVTIVDGDTLDVSVGDGTERVRLLGVDAPESVARNVPVQCFGAEASAALAGLLPAGTEVAISRDVEARDRYGRLLLYLETSDGRPVNEWLVESGFAAAVSYEPNTANAVALAAAERRAIDAGAGLWGACDGPDQPLR